MGKNIAKCILVHGGLSGSYQWDKISDYLKSRNILISAPQLPGMGTENSQDIDLDNHISHLTEIIRNTEENSFLAAFSFGGLAATAACCSLTDYIKKIIYIDSFFPYPGESFADIIGEKICRQIQNIYNTNKMNSIPAFFPTGEYNISQPLGTIFSKINYNAKDLSRLDPHYIRLSAKNPGWTFTPVLDRQFSKYCSLGFEYSEIDEDHTLNGVKWKKIAEKLIEIILEHLTKKDRPESGRP